MFKAVFFALSRFYRHAGDGSRKYLNGLVAGAIQSKSPAPDEEADEHGFVRLRDITLRDDAPQPGNMSLMAEIDAVDLGSGPGAMAELSIFDPSADLSATPGAMIEEARDIIAPRDTETNLVDFPDKDLHDLLDRHVVLYDTNQARLYTLIFAAAVAQTLWVLFCYVGFVGLNTVQMQHFDGTDAVITTLVLAGVTAIFIIGGFLALRHYCKTVIHYFKAACAATSAVIVTNITQRQEAVIGDLHSHFDALNRTCLVSPADDKNLETRVGNSVRMIFRARRRLNRNREYLRLSMRAIGMSYLARGSETTVGHIGWSWAIGNFALGLVPRIGVWFFILILLGAASLLPIIMPLLQVDGGLRLPSLAELQANPALPLALAQAATCLLVFIIAGGFILNAHARIMRPPITPADVRDITKEESLKKVKGAREARVTSRFVDLLVLLLYRLRKEEDRNH